MAVGRRPAVERHRNVRARERWEAALDFDYLLVLGGSGVELFDGKFFAGVLSVQPILCEGAEFEPSLDGERAA